MKFLRNLLGGLIVFLSNVFKPKVVVNRSLKEQAKADEACRDLALYQFVNCPFCTKVRRQLTRLNLKVDLKNCDRDETLKEELIQGGGKRTVPCLRIKQGDGSYKWMYDSSTINEYLSGKFNQN